MRITNAELYGNLSKVSYKVAQRRLRLAGHVQRHPELTLHSVLLWEPLHGRAQRGRPHLTYVDTLGVFYLPRDSGNSGWDVNGTHFFSTFHWKISGRNGTSEKLVLFSRWKLSDGKCVFHLRVSQGFTSSRPFTRVILR